MSASTRSSTPGRRGARLVRRAPPAMARPRARPLSCRTASRRSSFQPVLVDALDRQGVCNAFLFGPHLAHLTLGRLRAVVSDGKPANVFERLAPGRGHARTAIDAYVEPHATDQDRGARIR